MNQTKENQEQELQELISILKVMTPEQLQQFKQAAAPFVVSTLK